MRKLLRFLLFSAVLTCGFAKTGMAAAKPDSKVPSVLKTDSSQIVLRKFDTAAVNIYLKQREFNYHETDKPTNMWGKFWDWLWRIIFEWFNSRSDTGTTATPGLFVKYALLAIAIGLIIWFIIKIAGLEGVFNKKAKQASLPYTESLESIHDISFEEQIEKATMEGNYRLAVRLLYLQCLKQLNDANLIKWQIEKTNLAYVDEYVWYGGFSVNKRLYEEINTQFVNFTKTLA
jgi:hypothetical protein